MRKIILNLAVSLDGFIEGPNGEFDWCMTDQDYGMTEFMNRVDTILFGRKSYELLIKMDPTAYPDKAKYVFSHTLPIVPAPVHLVSGDVTKVVEQIKSQPGKDIWLFGGANLTTRFINAGLIDELQLSIHPLLLGKGKPLFSGIESRVPYTLIDTKTYATGLLQVFYQLNENSPE
jgi:dihydrofolate reductase